MPTTYIAQIDESKADRKLLVTEGYSLLLAKSVDFGSGSSSINFVYESKDLAPHMKISWVASYGLNWSTDMSQPGAQVNYTGDWQQCDLGQSFTLTEDGGWVASQKNPNAKEDSLNVAANNYSKEVHIVVGIWVGKDALLRGSHGEYKPLETINIRYQEGEKSATVISNQATPVQVHDMGPTPYFFSYDATAGKWRTPQDTAFVFNQ
ncbi:hypothetical protein FAVG1_08568 [Fusarium avenaceum]|nr:hypothetical protein FAVG1_08568 [Fusarium avenaceum]